MDRSEYLQRLHSRFGVGRAEIISTVEDATGKSVTNANRIIRGDEYEVHRVLLHDDSSVYLRVTFPGTPPSKAEQEAWAMARARENDAPVPEVLRVSVIDTEDGPRAAMVVRACPGRSLAEILDALRPEQRSMAMTNIGRVLAVLHSIPMPGIGRPNAGGAWPDPHQDSDRYSATSLAAADQLAVADFSAREIDRVKRVLRQEEPTDEDPVLCHRDVSPEHVFIADDLNVVGLIDWGMWSAGPAVAELAGLAVRNSQPDYDAITAGYGRDDLPASSINWHAIDQLVGQMNWLVTSGQTDELARRAAALRSALTHFADTR